MANSVNFDIYNMSMSQLYDFENLLKKIVGSIQGTFNYDGDDYSLRVENINYNKDFSRLDLKAQLKAKDHNRDYTMPIKGDFVLFDSNGRELERKRKTIVKIPQPTGRGTYILGGREYNIKYQLRLKPGAYITKKEGGTQAFINTATRQNLKLFFDPDTSHFEMQIGGRKFDVKNMLVGLGVDERVIERAWGAPISMATKVSEKHQHKTINSLYSTMYAFNKEAIPLDEQRQQVIAALGETELDPWTTKVTLGKETPNLNPQALLNITKEMLKVSRGARKPDNRDALYFKRPFGIDDMVQVSMDKQKRVIQNKLNHRLKANRGLDYVLSRPMVNFNKSIRDKFILDELSSNEEQVNPLELISNMNSVTLMGEGGIPSTHAITNQTREVNDTFLNFIDPLQTPSGSKVGVNLNLAYSTAKANDNLTAKFYSIKDKKLKLFSPEDIYDKYVALPNQVQRSGNQARGLYGSVEALHKGEIKTIPAAKVDLIVPYASHTLGHISNLLPMINHNMSIRNKYAVQQFKQALPLKYRESPLVQVDVGETGGVNVSGEFLARRSISTRVPSDISKGSVVKQVRKDKIIVTDSAGVDHHVEIYDKFPLNSHVALQSSPIVKRGDVVNPGDIIADSNFVKDGVLAAGVNLRTAYIPYKGLNYMDGIVITDSAAKKLTSTHSYQEEHTKTRDDVLSKKAFISHYPGEYKKNQLDKLDDDGVVKVGEWVSEGDPLMVKLSKHRLTEDDILRGNISSVFKRPLVKDAKSWDHGTDAKVAKVVKGQGFVKIYLDAEEPAKVGDKISQRAGAKGVITTIIPDAEAPRDAYGKPVELIQNPAAVPSRMNVAQIYETALAKVAQKTGKPYLVDSFSKLKSSDVEAILKEHNLNAEEKLFDPDGTELGKIFVGPQYFVKMKQQAEKGFKARGRKDAYELTTRRPHKGPKLDTLGFYAMLAHGVPNVMREMGTSTAEMNDNYWRKIEMGLTPPPPRRPYALIQLTNMLKASGINISEDGDDFTLSPLTDYDIDKLGAKEVPNPGKAVRIGSPGSKNFLAPEDGGLYDHNIFGGLEGDKWGKITLNDKFPNPLFEDAIRSIGHLTGSEFAGLVKGTEGLKDGNVVPLKDAQVTGGQAWEVLLGKIKPAARVKEILEAIPHKRGSGRDALIKEMKYLKALNALKMQPTDYLLTKFPILPPKFRPIYLTKDGRLRTSDLTDLYRDMGLANNALKDVGGLPSSMVQNLRGDFYASLKAVQGIAQSENLSRRQSQGLLAYIKGTSPPQGFFQNKLLSKRQAIGGQGVIMPDPSLDIDTIKLPEDMAWTIMKPFLMRRLTKAGIAPLRAKQLINDRHTTASRALDLELADRPVILHRDPKLHKYNYLGFYAQRHPGKSIHIPPLIVKGFNADFDGDKMGVNVPSSPEAVRDVKTRMMPSQNALKYGIDSIIIAPEEDVIAGLYKGTMLGRKQSKEYATPAEALVAYGNKNIKLTDGVLVNGQWTTAGRCLVNEMLPEKYKNYEKTWGDGEMREVLNDVIRKSPNDYTRIVQGFKNLGEDFGYKTGLSFALSDFKQMDDRRELDRLGSVTSPPANYGKIDEQIKKRLQTHLKPSSALRIMAESGAKGSWGNVKQMLYSPIFMNDSSKVPYPHIVKTGFAEGMDFRDFWTAAKSGRVGEMSKSLETADPGYFGKQVMRSGLGGVIQAGDINHGDGISYASNSPHVLHRYLATDAIDRNGNVIAPANALITKEVINSAQGAGVRSFNVRSPLTTDAAQGFYAKDFGRLPTGHKPHVGTDIGVISGHTITQPSTQLVLKSFHTGGTVGDNKQIGLYEIWPLLTGRAPAGQEAIMSPYRTIVNKIIPLKSGAKEVLFSNGNKLVTTPGMPMLVKAGDKVNKGQALQMGLFNPKKLLEYKGLRSLQGYLVEQLENAYGRSAPDRRYLETIVAGLTKYGKVKKPGDSQRFTYDDVVPIAQIKNENRHLAKSQSQSIEYEPIFYGMEQQLAQGSDDWMQKMIGSDMVRQLRRGAALGIKSPIHSTIPIMPFMYGTDFGKRLETEGVY